MNQKGSENNEKATIIIFMLMYAPTAVVGVRNQLHTERGRSGNTSEQTNNAGNNSSANGNNVTGTGRAITEADLKEIDSRVNNINNGVFATVPYQPTSSFAGTDKPRIALLSTSPSDEVPDLKASGMDYTWEEYEALLRMSGMSEAEIENIKQMLLNAQRDMQEVFAADGRGNKK